MLQAFIDAIVAFVHEFGYLGIFIMTFIESSFLPVPAEITMVPAGYLVSEKEMNGGWVMLSATLGTVAGALLNYWIAMRYGRSLLLKYSRFFFLNEKKLARIESFFEEHGGISTFTGRLIPGLRHFISFPAGLARMNLKRFCFYTGLGGGLWMFALMMLGYFIGENKALVKQWLPYLTGKFLILVLVVVAGYVWFQRRRARRADSVK